MKVYQQADPKDWGKILARPVSKARSVEKTVRAILSDVESKGDKAVLKYSAKFDKVKFKEYQVSAEEITTAAEQLSPELKAAMQLAYQNIHKFHAAQRQNSHVIETMPGIRTWRRLVPIGKVGLYIPSGTAPLFSTVLMLGIPAKLMGCEEIIICVPPLADGSVHAAILYAAKLCGIDKIYKVGGAQAIAAMAYGTETVPKVYKIFGPGNNYVTTAKQIVSQEGVAIDMPAGPSELMVLADAEMPAAYAAADLLSQAEHGPDSQVIFATTDNAYLEAVQAEIEAQLKELPRKAIAKKALAKSAAFVFEKEQDLIDLANTYAPEHLIIGLRNANAVAMRITNASAIFLGKYAPESVGDYAAGPNHTLPTSGYARMYSGVMLESFGKMVTYQQLTAEGLQAIGPAVEIMAEQEELIGHKNAVSIRLKDLNNNKE
jgi:histidinol dehydrogenase